MMESSMMTSDVLIVGAGPTGLVLALWLSKLGARVRLIDKTDAPGTTSRALAVHARTLELYRQLDLADAVIAQGHKTPAVGLWVQGERRARISFEDVGSELTPYPFLHIFPQDEHEKLLIARLEQFGVTVERRTELMEYSDDGVRIAARLEGPRGEERCEASYVAGCDGARSLVRQSMGAGFPGGTYQQIFYVADVEASGPAVNGDLGVDLDEADFLAVFPLKGEGRIRLIGTVRDERAEHADTLKFSDVSERSIEKLKVDVKKVNWFSTYHVHHRVTEHFRKGRAFLLGDAAHIHSPAGGQGMNTGIGDAINLAWKLKAVLDGRAGDALLDSYGAERIPFAKRLVQTTDRVFALATAEGPFASFARTRIAPVVLPAAASFETLREWMFRTVSQVLINYRGGPISAGAAGKVHGGDRLPWVRSGSSDNYASLAAMRWQMHVYGKPRGGAEAWRRDHDVPLTVFAWSEAHAAAGLKEDALYLMRPDGYVALASEGGQGLERYFADHMIQP
jgi:2-polyprenyl-6-methoxyphenol hydroxylase-like FAD-dependent oxidoreductase